MYNYIESQEAWLLDRVGKFTASEIWKLMTKGRSKEYFGEQAKTYIRNKAAELLTNQAVGFKREGIDAIEWGNSLEMEAVQEFEKRYGVSVEYFGKANPKFFPYTEYSGGSPDGLIGDNRLIEVKCPYNSGEHLEHLLLTGEDELKDYAKEYYYQIQANLLFTNRTKGYLVSYDPRFPKKEYQLKVLSVERNEEDIKEMKERINEAEKQLALIVGLLSDAFEPSILLAEYNQNDKLTIIQ